MMKVIKQATKRGLALFIALMMSLSVMQLTAFAAEEDGLPTPDAETITDLTETETDSTALPNEQQPVEDAGEAQEPTEVEEPVETEQPVESGEPVVPEGPAEAEEPSDAEPAEEEVVEPVMDAEPVEEEEPVATGDVPYFESFSLNGTVGEKVGQGGFALHVPNDTPFSTAAVVFETSELVTFEKTANPATNTLYVEEGGDSSATLKLKVDVSGVPGLGDLANVSIKLSRTDDTHWNGYVNSLVNVPISTLANIFANQQVTFPAGSLKTAGGQVNEDLFIGFEQDNNNTYMYAHTTANPLYRVTYSYGSLSTTWRLPKDMTIPQPTFTMQAGQEFVRWMMGPDFTSPVSASDKVSGDITIQAQVRTTSTSSKLEDQLQEEGRTEFTITDADDWNTFVLHAGDFKTNHTVTLLTDINCNGASYVSMNFKGNFNGYSASDNKVHKISNATFTPNGDCNGLFVTIGSGQKVVNLILENITVKDGTYAGTLAGTANQNALIQNVHARNCWVSGRTAAGILGHSTAATVKFCSFTNDADSRFKGSVSGTANSGGIVGISYGTVSNCYSICNLGGLFKRGGIVSSNIECGKVEYCWCTASKAVYMQNGASTTDHIVEGSDSDDLSAFEDAGFNETYWILGSDGTTTFNFSKIIYK